jgi:hypothetical protein
MMICPLARCSNQHIIITTNYLIIVEMISSDHFINNRPQVWGGSRFRFEMNFSGLSVRRVGVITRSMKFRSVSAN